MEMQSNTAKAMSKMPYTCTMRLLFKKLKKDEPLLFLPFFEALFAFFEATFCFLLFWVTFLLVCW
jgi:hypothetical protein